MKRAYYNDVDPFCCRVLRKQIAAGNLPLGDVDERDIRLVNADELRGYGQIHLFAGIGGFPLGFRRAGLPDEFHVLTGGFPCQDISMCGDRAGIDANRSGLWREMCRIICQLGRQLHFVTVENVSALLIPEGQQPAAIGRVLGDLAACGFDAEWECLPASAFGAYHERDRTFIVAYPSGLNGGSHDLLEARREWGSSLQSRRLSCMAVAARGQQENTRLRSEPGLDRLVRRLPGALDRLEGIGDAIYPAVAEWIGRRIMEA